MERPSAVATRALIGLVAVLLVIGCGRGRQEPPPDGLLGELAAGAIHVGALDPGREACAPFLGEGWHKAEKTAGGAPFRWTSATVATLQFTGLEPAPGRFVLHGYTLYAGERERRCELLINGLSLGEAILPASLETAMWTVPEGVLADGGRNLVTLRIDHTVNPAGDSRRLGVLVDWLGFVPAGTPAYTNPYENAPTTELTGSTALSARLAGAAGATLVLSWTPTPAQLRVALVVRGGDSIFSESLAGAAGAARLQLPPELPASIRLVIHGADTRLLTASVEHPGS